MSWQNIAKNVAPTLASALPPPFNVFATAAVKGVLGLTEESTDKDVERALLSATPETMLKLKELENQFKIDCKKLGVDLEQIAYQDRDSARKRESETKDKMPAILGITTVVGVIVVFSIVLSGNIELTGEQGLMVGTIVGAIIGYGTQVMNYYFGSTSGSAKKTEIMVRGSNLRG